jgi:flagellar basal body rod protein FlgG
MRALSTASTGMMAMELNVQVIANNLANMTTTGYKRQRAEFQDLLYDHVSRIGTQTSVQGNILPVGIDLGSGVKPVGTPLDGLPNTDGTGDLQQGNLEQSNVDSVTEITNLIAAQRAYEMNGKVITAADQMLQSTAGLMR